MKEQSPCVVVFDLGGVMIEICHTWELAANRAGVRTGLDLDGATGIVQCPPFMRFQRGETEVSQYAQELAEWLGCGAQEALGVHEAIIRDEYPGIPELVSELRGAGVKLACLSNTNGPHWERLDDGALYPSIHALDFKMVSHLVGLEKPDPAIFDLFCVQCGSRPCEIVYFDDSRENALAAEALGWSSYRIDPCANPPQQMRKHLAAEGVLTAPQIA